LYGEQEVHLICVVKFKHNLCNYLVCLQPDNLRAKKF